MDGAAYGKALAEELKNLVCGDDTAVTIVVVRNAQFADRLRLQLDVTWSQAPALNDFIMSKNCPVSASLTDADKANLLRIKQDAIKKPEG